jgi:hypothetical protein
VVTSAFVSLLDFHLLFSIELFFQMCIEIIG